MLTFGHLDVSGNKPCAESPVERGISTAKSRPVPLPSLSVSSG
jgi:hypothetical protein